MESNPRRRRCREIVRAASLARDRSSAPGSTFGRSAVWLNRVVATSLQSPSTTTATTMMRTTMTTMITGSECRRATSHDFVERARALVYTHSRVRSNSFHTDAALWSIGRNSREISAGRRTQTKGKRVQVQDELKRTGLFVRNSPLPARIPLRASGAEEKLQPSARPLNAITTRRDFWPRGSIALPK